MRQGGRSAAPRVLVVEDNPINLELVKELLELEGCQVLVAESAEASLQLAASEQPDLVLMDLQLGGMSGYDATRHLKAAPATASIPVLALTSFAMRGDDRKAMEAGCDGYLTKPLDMVLFREAVRRYLFPGGDGSNSGRGTR